MARARKAQRIESQKWRKKKTKIKEKTAGNHWTANRFPLLSAVIIFVPQSRHASDKLSRVSEVTPPKVGARL